MCTVTNGANIAFFLELNIYQFFNFLLKQERDYIIREKENAISERRTKQQFQFGMMAAASRVHPFCAKTSS